MEKTIFEKIIDREIPAEVIYEDDDFFAFLDAFPQDKGHTLVIPKKPYVYMWDMSEEEYHDLQSVVYKVASHMNTTLGKDIAVFQRNGSDAGQEVMHVHVHLVPRYQNEQTQPIFNYTSEKTTAYISDDERGEFAEKLKMI